MPYVEEEKKIKTKVIGVASIADDNDQIKVRQVILNEISEEPEMVSMFYLRKREVWIMLQDGREFMMGQIKSEYENLIMSNATQIISWQVTGGQDIPRKQLLIGGYVTPIGETIRAKRGLNIHIKLF